MAFLSMLIHVKCLRKFRLDSYWYPLDVFEEKNFQVQQEIRRKCWKKQIKQLRRSPLLKLVFVVIYHSRNMEWQNARVLQKISHLILITKIGC